MDAAASESLWQTVRADLRRARGPGLLGVAAMLAWMAFQWGWGNDILLPPIVANAFEPVDDRETWSSAFAAVLAGTGAGSAFWALTQTIDGLVVLGGLRFIPGITQRISAFLKRQGWVKPYAELSFGTRFLIAYLSGASVLCLVDVFATGEPGLRSRRLMLAKSVGLSVAGVALVIAVVTSATAIGARVPALADEAEVVLRYAKNPLTWLVIYGSLVSLSSLVSRLRASNAEPA